MPANVDGMVREGISAYRAGRKEEARTLLLRAVEIDQYNEEAWLWLSAVVKSVEEQRTCLENVLTINPSSERAKQGLQMLSQKGSPEVSPSAASSQADDVLASSSFTPPPQAPTNVFDAQPDELPTSIEWDTPPAPPPTATSSASSNYQVAEPSEAEYDDWVSNLGLGGSSTPETSTFPLDAAQQFISSSFDEDEAFGLDMNADEDDLFASGPFSAPDTPLPISTPEPPARTPPPKSPSKSSPVSKAASDPLLDDIEDEEVVNNAFLDAYDDVELEKLEASEFFQYIPKEIKSTRLPGTRERYPILVILGFIGLVLLNVGAVAFLVMNLTAK